ncbi:hypothetical protein BaRGS_00020542, partial [Batillaria attramentaria]
VNAPSPRYRQRHRSAPRPDSDTVKVDKDVGRWSFLVCGVTDRNTAALTLPSDTRRWREAVTIERGYVENYGVMVRLDAVKGNMLFRFLFCGVTVGDPATLTLPSDTGGWKEAVTIGLDFVRDYDLHPSSYNQDCLMVEEEHPEPRWLSGSFQLTSYNEMIFRVTGRQLVHLHPSSYNHDYLMAEEEHSEPRWLSGSFQLSTRNEILSK